MYGDKHNSITIATFNSIGLSINYADIDECEGGFDTCGDGSGGGCVNTIGSYECGCANGFVLDGDNQCMGTSVFLIVQYM